MSKQIVLNDVTLSYEVIGHGKPMVFVHGNGEDHRIFDKTADVLKDQFTCYLVDSRGHGKSSEIASFHYREMAMDMILFMDKLGLQDVTFVGFSDGGIIGLLAAGMTRRITRLVVCGANTKPSGLKAHFLIGMRIANFFKRDPLIKLMLTEPDITDDELSRISAKTLVLAGSRDLIRREETDHIADTVPNAQEHILPGETHMSYVVHSDKLAHEILTFMAE